MLENNIKINYASVFRLFRVADKLIAAGGELSDFEINTYKYMYNQLNDDQKSHLQETFSDTLDNVIKEYSDELEAIVVKRVN